MLTGGNKNLIKFGPQHNYGRRRH